MGLADVAIRARPSMDLPQFYCFITAIKLVAWSLRGGKCCLIKEAAGLPAPMSSTPVSFMLSLETSFKADMLVRICNTHRMKLLGSQ